VQRNRDLAKAAVVFTSDENDVVAFAHRDCLLSRAMGWFLGIRESDGMRMRFAGTHLTLPNWER
jgi:hypothetical protein